MQQQRVNTPPVPFDEAVSLKIFKGFIRFMATPNEVTGPINLGNPTKFTIRSLAEQVVALTGSRSKLIFVPLPSDDPKQRKPDISLANQVLGWQPTVQLNDGLQKTIEYFEHILRT